MGVDLKAIRDKRTNLNAQEIGDARSAPATGSGYEHNPVFDAAEVAKMAAAGVQRLADMQLSDGGWGWFSGYGEHSSPHTTAVVVHGLQIARENDVALPRACSNAASRGSRATRPSRSSSSRTASAKIKPYKEHADDLDALVYMVLADGEVRNDDMLGFLDRDRTHLAGLRQGHVRPGPGEGGEKDKLAMVLQNIASTWWRTTRTRPRT